MDGSAFDLDQFAPFAVEITLRGTHFRLNGDPDVDVIARMLRIEESIRDASEAGQIKAIVAAVQEGKKLIADLILDIDSSQDVSKLKLNTQDVMTLFALVMHGGSVASVVAQALSRPSDLGEDAEERVATPESDEDAVREGGDATPLVSASSSSARSSTSDDTDDGVPVTGTA